MLHKAIAAIALIHNVLSTRSAERPAAAIALRPRLWINRVCG